MTRKILQQALEALDDGHVDRAYGYIQDLLEQPVQPKREWVELSKIEEEQCFEESSCPLAAVRNASTKLKEKNT